MSTDEKLDTLLALFDSFKESQIKIQKTAEDKLQKFKGDLEAMKASQENATERALQRIQRDRPMQF